MDKNKEDEILSDDLLETEARDRPCLNNGRQDFQTLTAENKTKAFMSYFGIQSDYVYKWEPTVLFYMLKMHERCVDFEAKLKVNQIEQMMKNSNLPFLEFEFEIVRSLPNILDVSNTINKQQTLNRIKNLEFIPGYTTSGLHYGVYGLKSPMKNSSLLGIDVRNIKRGLDKWLLFSLFDENSKMIHQNNMRRVPEKILEFMNENGIQICCKRRSLNGLYILNSDELKSCDNIAIRIFRLESAKFQNHLQGKHYCRFEDYTDDSWETVKKQKRE